MNLGQRDKPPAAKAYYNELGNLKQNWKYYERQISYIAGQDPENRVNVPLGAITEYGAYFDRWRKIQNKDDEPIKELLSYPQNILQQTQKGFLEWQRGSEQRLRALRDAL